MTLLLALLQGTTAGGERAQVSDASAVVDQPQAELNSEVETDGDAIQLVRAELLQPQPAVRPPIAAEAPIPTPAGPAAAAGLPRSLFDSSPAFGVGPASGGPASIGPRSRVAGSEAAPRAATDAGSLIFKSPAATGVGTQRRSPVMNDPRLRGGRVGQLAASGSHWIPARIDLDTAPSKFDARSLEEVTLIKGPYSALYGPNFRFLDVDFLNSPRFDGPTSVGSSSAEYKSNGDAWYGRQMFAAGDEDWGVRFAYGHRTANDYLAGDGVTYIPASYNSRDAELAMGFDVSDDSRLEFHYLRVDQTGVELPGQAFDIDTLQTDGFDLEYVLADQPGVDLLTAEGWFNQTNLTGDAQRPGKRRQFPFLDFINFQGVTNVQTISTGGQLLAQWGDAQDQLVIGADVRVINQQLAEITSGRLGFLIFNDVNSPLPKSTSVNPGLLVERSWQNNEGGTLRLGGRVDLQHSEVVDPGAGAQPVGPSQIALADVYGSNDLASTFGLWSLYATGEAPLSDSLWATAGVGHGQRPPSLTELYVAQSFMFLLQNGLNTVTGDPRLQTEKLTQFDLGLRWDADRTRAYVNGYYAIANDYITFENLSVVTAPPLGQVEQVNLKYVNTQLATFTGVDLGWEYDYASWLEPFATLQWVEGIDQTRNGDYATRAASVVQPSARVAGLARGSFSGVAGASSEALPGIIPLESRVGFRLHPQPDAPAWEVEFGARVVRHQNFVARSLLELPTPGFTVFDVRSYWQASKSLRLIGGVENFGDRFYREHLDFRSQNGLQGMYQPGVSVYASAELNY